MLRNFWKIAYRNLVRNKFFSLVNIFGLAIGMAACWFIFEYVRFELSYDKWHKNAARLYRVPIDFAKTYMLTDAIADNYPAAGPTMKADFPEVVEFARLAPAQNLINTPMLSFTMGRGRPGASMNRSCISPILPSSPCSIFRSYRVIRARPLLNLARS